MHAQETARAKALGKRVICMCGGCKDSVGLCNHVGGTFSGPCETARGMQKDLDAHVAAGESDDLILQAFVQQYGPTVLVEPPKKGFDLLAWIMPIAVPLIALVLVWEVVRRWRHKAALAPAGGPPASCSNSWPRVQREAGREPDVKMICNAMSASDEYVDVACLRLARRARDLFHLRRQAAKLPIPRRIAPSSTS